MALPLPRHKTLWILLFWLAAVPTGLVVQVTVTTQLPLQPLVVLAGVVTAAYIGLEQAGNVVASARLPSGFGVTPHTARYLWVTVAWLIFLLQGLVVQYLVAEPITVPLDDLVAFAGVVSAVYVGGNKAHRAAVCAGGEKS